jgi:ferredoxin
MTYVITEPCKGVKDAACVEVCPVDMYYIDPEECIDCGACLPVCPVEAIYPDDDIPEGQEQYLEVNAAFYQK